jgi:thiamine biosynthesis lipoprotein
MDNRCINRRSFIKLSGLLGLGLATGSLFPVTAEAVRFNRKMQKVSKTRLAMGTFVSMTLLDPSRDRAEEAMALAFDEIDRLTHIMSRFDETTAVAQLNKEGYLRDIPPEVSQVISRALYYHRVTDGCFDITVKPIVDLFKDTYNGDGKSLPSQKELEAAVERVGAGHIELKDREVHFKKAGMGITLDGIAKGYIVDMASKRLAEQGVKNHLINAGGDIRTSGEKAEKRPWTVAIQDPMKRRNYPDIIHLRDGAVATSGDYEVYFDREKMFHHIVNPRTGISPDGNTSVSVIAPSTMDADALATSVFVMDYGEGIGFINRQPQCETLVITKDGRQKKSAGWKSAAI